MRDEYGVSISRQQQQLFEAWAKQDPVDAWERERNRRIAAIQGHGNPYVAAVSVPEKRDRKSDPVFPTEEKQFSCSTRKTCGQMSSCEEARYHLTQCGNTRLDRDHDGVPCESICR